MSEVIEEGEAVDEQEKDVFKDAIQMRINESIAMKYGRRCLICDESFEIFSIRSTEDICPECRKRLKTLLYGDEK